MRIPARGRHRGNLELPGSAQKDLFPPFWFWRERNRRKTLKSQGKSARWPHGFSSHRAALTGIAEGISSRKYNARTIAGGTFSPDFMYVVKKTDGTKELNLVVETKDVESETELREDVQMKISCARIFFQNLEAEGYTVKFHAQLKRDKMKKIIDDVLAS